MAPYRDLNGASQLSIMPISHVITFQHYAAPRTSPYHLIPQNICTILALFIESQTSLEHFATILCTHQYSAAIGSTWQELLARALFHSMLFTTLYNILLHPIVALKIFWSSRQYLVGAYCTQGSSLYFKLGKGPMLSSKYHRNLVSFQVKLLL